MIIRRLIAGNSRFALQKLPDSHPARAGAEKCPVEKQYITPCGLWQTNQTDDRLLCPCLASSRSGEFLDGQRGELVLGHLLNRL